MVCARTARLRLTRETRKKREAHTETLSAGHYAEDCGCGRYRARAAGGAQLCAVLRLDARQQHSIILPGSEGDSPTVGAGSALLTGQSVDDITIGVNNAKTVIATLARPAAYSSRIENTIYYDGGSAALYCHRYARDNVMRTDTLGSDNQVQSTLIRVPDGKVYAWNAGDSIAYQGKAGDFTDDAAAMLPTYEDVLADEVQLTAAGRQDINGEPCIAVTFEQDGYRCVYGISTVSGLLAQASFYDGDTLTRKVTVSELSTETPDSELFTLPDGESVI